MTNEHFKVPAPSGVPQQEPGVLELLKKIQQQLVYLERKIDALGGGASPRPFHQNRSFSRPPRSFDRAPHHGAPRREPGAGPSNFPKPFSKPSFQDRPPREERHGFSHGKKPFFRHRKGRA